jgi:hypothetical protein
MLDQLQPDAHIPHHIYQQVSLADLGTPIHTFRAIFLQLISIICLLIAILCVAALCYTIYGYFAFIPLAHAYPDILDVPLPQLDRYLWLEPLHNHFLLISSHSLLPILVSPLGSISAPTVCSKLRRKKPRSYAGTR